MNKIVFIISLFIINIQLTGIQFFEMDYINEGISTTGKDLSLKISDYNRNGSDEIVINSSNILFYEIQDNYFELIGEIDDTNYIFTCGSGDFDQDGLKDLLIGMPGDDKYMHLRILEQSDSTSFFDNLVWQSDTLYRTVKVLSITNKLKGDGVDRIYGAGIPWLSTPTKGYGWYYFTCTGDNQYEILNTFEESTQIQSAMDIGDIDNDSLTEVVLESYLKTQIFKYESVSSSDDSFEFTDSIMTYASPLCLLILPDIDKDGTNEVAEMLVNYIGYPTSYKCIIFEGTDTIFNRDFEVETDYIYNFNGDIDYGDIDGDSVNELVICGGRHIEVWESTGDNQFERMWEWTDPTYYTIQSHIKCHDFNKNGIDEIVFSGAGQAEECTRIFECDTTREPSAPEIVSAEANDGVIVEKGVDYDDYIRIEFEGLTNEPNINKSNIDSILRLSGGHSYLANGKYLDTCRWEIEEAKSVLYIELTQIQASPTVAVGDTIYPDGVTIRSFEYPVYAVVKPIVITGSFGPTGTGESHEPYAESHGLKMQIQSQYIVWNTNTEGTLTVYDISGREVIREESKTTGAHKTGIRHLKNGIYFIKLKDDNESITEKQVILK